MQNDRLRIPIDEPYLHAVGLAIICFARLEWGAAWCCEKLQTGYINSVREKTAGNIANDFVVISATHPNEDIRKDLSLAAEDFKALVKRRNDLVHASPGTASDNITHRFFRDGTELTIPMVDELSDQFAAVELRLSNFIHHVL